MSSPLPPQAVSCMTGLMAYTGLSGNECGGVRRGWGLTMCPGLGVNEDSEGETPSKVMSPKSKALNRGMHKEGL